MPTLAQAWARSPDVVGRHFGGEMVLVKVVDGGADLDRTRRLNRVAAVVWESLDGLRTGEAIVDALVARFQVNRDRAAADYLELLTMLRDMGAIVYQSATAE